MVYKDALETMRALALKGGLIKDIPRLNEEDESSCPCVRQNAIKKTDAVLLFVWSKPGVSSGGVVENKD